MKPLVKWPGGKGRLVKHLLPLIPEFSEYYEPFLGGGALFFSIEPKSARISDLSQELIGFYKQVQSSDGRFLGFVESFSRLFQLLGDVSGEHSFYTSYEISSRALGKLSDEGYLTQGSPIFSAPEISSYIDKASKHSKRLSTAAHSALYYFARDEYNNQAYEPDDAYLSSLFFLIRELCFGSMFRYNSKDQFNIPYGGFSYDKKDLFSKAALLRKAGSRCFFASAEIACLDFKSFLSCTSFSKQGFMFLDPPYDSHFKGYSGNNFEKKEHADLRDILRSTSCNYLLVVSKTDFIEGLYAGLDLNRIVLPSKYSYSIRGRNDRNVEYLILRNY